MQCPNCGKTVNDEFRFCKYCGQPLDNSREASNEENQNIIELTDENGNPIYFEFLDLITFRGEEYVVLLPMDESADEVVILKVESLSDENETYVSVDDENVLNMVFALFKERNHDYFSFTD